MMEHTANIINQNKGRIPSLLKEFEIFELRLIGDKKLDVISIRCINRKNKQVYI